MGGFGSGRWSRWGGNGRPTVEAVRSLDVNRWHREGYLRAGVFFSWKWTYADGDRAVINAEARSDEVVLRYRVRVNGGEWEDVEDVVPLERTPCRFGGFRSWFRCPRCRRRAGKLYQAAKRFLCRRCYGLAYDCQREKRDARARRRAFKIRRRLGGEANFVSPFPWKPKGMHWRTYLRWREEAQAAELDSLRDIGLWMDRMERTLRRGFSGR